MHQKSKPKNPWLVLIWLLWSLIAPGCAQFPDHSFTDCKTNYPNDPAMTEDCKKEVNQRAQRRMRREEKAAEKAACLWPHGVWVEPTGCRSTRTLL